MDLSKAKSDMQGYVLWQFLVNKEAPESSFMSHIQLNKYNTWEKMLINVRLENLILDKYPL